ncbi:MAG TPA: MotA/TolQ/ExbB proton channel family protein [Planctomycetota bacterium]|nr:MotA/TolQ/ExbB proton channel family protein [Planctomycetota bacterium]
MIDLFLRGGPVMWPLLLTSLVGLTFIIERTIFWLRVASGRDKALVLRFLELSDGARYAEAARSAQGSRDYVVGVLHSGLVHRNYSASGALQAAAADSYRRMRRFLSVLDTVVTIAPLLGILGTVTGIIACFNLMGDAGVADPGKATKGLAEALITTAAGLVIAIPTLLAFNFFSRQAERAAAEMETSASCLEICLARNESHGVRDPEETVGKASS